MDRERYYQWLNINKDSRVLLLFQQEPVPENDLKYDVILCIKALETKTAPADFLKEICQKLDENGTLYLFCDNRLGLRYFSGEKDPFTDCFGDGPDNYIHNCSVEGRCYSVNEILSLLHEAGMFNINLYSVLPSVENFKFIISSDYIPNEKMSIRMFPKYNDPDNLFFQEEYVIDELFRSGLMPGMADGLLFEVSKALRDKRYNEVIISGERKKEFAAVTYITRTGEVKKKALFEEGRERLLQRKNNEEKLKERGIRVVQGRLEEENGTLYFVSSFQKEILANQYLQQLLFKDRDKFIREMDRFREEILKASPIIDKNGNIQETAYPDMVPLNCFVQGNAFVFFDQEFSIRNYSADSIIARAILIVYEADGKMEALLPKSFFFDRYHLSENLDELLKEAFAFTDELYNQGNSAGRRIAADFFSNRARMNYPERQYEKLFYNPVSGLENKVIYLAGETEACGKFIEMYQRDFEIRGLISLEKELPRDQLMGYPVYILDRIRQFTARSCRVIVCRGDFARIRMYLSHCGLWDVVYYDPEKVYPGRQAGLLPVKSPEKKQYHVGYVAGVFDLYHIGHLNMFKRAKELCDYLIVGVVTDQGVRDFKRTEPFIPFDERIEMVRSCVYVDEAVEIPYYYRGTKEAFEKYHFDVQFSGSDYANSPLWLKHKQWLEERGSAMVFFPYTEGISSSKIKKMIDRSLIDEA